jgi:ribosomal protein S18 acetylase RimI-like enzyme
MRFHRVICINNQKITIEHKRISSNKYIAFLKNSNLGSQYPKEEFNKRIATLLDNVQISLVATDQERNIIGVCLGLTEFAYWLFITDIGVVRNWEKRGLGKIMISICHEIAGGEKKIIMFAYVNENAIPFYENIGMKKTNEVMEKNKIEWTNFIVK